MEYLLVDSTILRAHACAIPKENDKKTTVVHAVSDALGHPLNFIVTAGQKHDAPLATELIDGLAAKHWLADKCYDNDAIRDCASHKGHTATEKPKRRETLRQASV